MSILPLHLENIHMQQWVNRVVDYSIAAYRDCRMAIGYLTLRSARPRLVYEQPWRRPTFGGLYTSPGFPATETD